MNERKLCLMTVLSWIAVPLLVAAPRSQTLESSPDGSERAPCALGALEPCEELCQEGSMDACVTLARMLASGHGAATNHARAYTLLSEACTNGHVVGCGALGELYLAGWGVARDVTRGMELLRHSCERGDGLSCESLGGLYSGLHADVVDFVEPDLAASARWWERACELDVVSACVSLAALLADGAGVPRDQERAAGLLIRGCDGEIPVACKLLADMFVEGQGVPHDEDRADALYARACELGYERACEP